MRPIDYQDIIYYSAPKQKPSLKSLDEVDPEIRKTFDKLGIPIEEQKLFSGVAVDAVFDSVSVATTFKKQLAEVGHHLLLVLRSRAESSGAREEVSRVGRAAHRQLLRGAELGRVLRRLVRLHPEGRPLPDGAVDLLPHQREGVRTVRAHADRGRRRRVCQLPRRAARRRCATSTSCTRRSSSSWRWTTPRSNTRRSRTGIPATRTARAASTTS